MASFTARASLTRNHKNDCYIRDRGLVVFTSVFFFIISVCDTEIVVVCRRSRLGSLLGSAPPGRGRIFIGLGPFFPPAEALARAMTRAATSR